MGFAWESFVTVLGSTSRRLIRLPEPTTLQPVQTLKCAQNPAECARRGDQFLGPV